MANFTKVCSLDSAFHSAFRGVFSKIIEVSKIGCHLKTSYCRKVKLCTDKANKSYYVSQVESDLTCIWFQRKWNLKSTPDFRCLSPSLRQAHLLKNTHESRRTLRRHAGKEEGFAMHCGRYEIWILEKFFDDISINKKF